MRLTNRYIVEGATQEIPSGSINGSNKVFTVANTPDDSANVIVYLNGVVQRITTDYSISGTTITFVTAPALGQDLSVIYQKRT